MKKTALTILTILLLSTGCGGGKEEPQAPILKQTASDEILRISEGWSSVQPDKGILSPPSKISLYSRFWRSEITLTPTSGQEVLIIEEELQLRAGGEVRCRTRFEHPIRVKYGRRQGEAAVELQRPPIGGNRSCEGLHPDGPINEGALRGLFVLRSDKLIGIEPALEKRTFIPKSL